MTGQPGAVIHLFVGTPAWSRPAADALVKSLVGEATPLNPVTLSEEQLRADPSLLLAELSTVPMFGGRPVVWVRAGSGVVCQQVEDLLDDALPAGAGTLVVELEALPAPSTIPSRRRDGRLALTVEPVISPAELVSGLAAAHGLRLDPAAIECLLELCDGDRGLLANELGKIAAYVGSGAGVIVGSETVLAVCGDVSQITVEEMVVAAMTGGAAAVGPALLRSRETGATGHQLASGVVQRLFRDLRFRSDRPSRSGSMAGDDLGDLARDVFEMIRDTRLSSGFDQEIAERFLLRLAISRTRQP